jgi:phosphopantetheinyl transferase (holo-ACP synthase)
MIGNDIVDLQLAKTQSNWQRRGWLQKIFTVKEQQHIFISGNKELQIWIFWSMKEAAYKAHQQRFGFFPRYNPKSFQCTLKGAVNVNNETYKIVTEIQNGYVHSIAMLSHIDYLSSIYTKRVDLYKKLKRSIAQKLNIDSSLIYFQKDCKGIPRIKIDQKTMQLPISLTHHGKYSAFVVSV